MVTEANPNASAEGEPQQTDWKAKAEAAEAALTTKTQEHESLQKSHASVQRTLERTRTQAATEQTTAAEIKSLREQVAALVGVVGRSEDLDPESKAVLTGVTASAQQSQQRTAAVEQVRQQIASLAGEAGLTDWSDPRASDIVEAVGEGDWMEALHLAKALRRTAKQKPETKVEPAKEKEDVADELKIKAEVERQLKAAGFRTVDTGKASGGTPAPSTYADLLKTDTRKMSLAQLKTHRAEILAARKAGS